MNATAMTRPMRAVVRRLPSRSENARAKGERRDTVGPIVAMGSTLATVGAPETPLGRPDHPLEGCRPGPPSLHLPRCSPVPGDGARHGEPRWSSSRSPRRAHSRARPPPGPSTARSTTWPRTRIRAAAASPRRAAPTPRSRPGRPWRSPPPRARGRGREAPLRRALVRTVGPAGWATSSGPRSRSPRPGWIRARSAAATSSARSSPPSGRTARSAPTPPRRRGGSSPCAPVGSRPRPARSCAPGDALERTQRSDGGWALAGGSPGSGPNTTADAVQALVAAGRPPTVTVAGAGRAASCAPRRTPTAASRRSSGAPSTALTTAWVALSLRALGERGNAAPWNRAGGPRAFLARLQRPDGAVRNTPAAPATSVWATSQTALAFGGRPLPDPRPARARHRARSLTGERACLRPGALPHSVCRYDTPG